VSELPETAQRWPADPSDGPEDAIQQIRASLRGLRFGSVHIIVQDGVVIQIDRTEKKRLRCRTDKR
jgi:hypothetical protein